MLFPICDTDLVLLLREADVAAAWLVRRLRLPEHEREDLRQDLLIDLISRIKGFDPARGSLGAFAGKVIAHRATRLMGRLRREREAFPAVSLDDPLPGYEGTTLGDTIAESDGYPAMMGQPSDGFAAIERRLDLDRALGYLRRSDLSLCAMLVHQTPTELSEDGLRSRATLYRQLRDLRLRLMAGGLSEAA